MVVFQLENDHTPGDGVFDQWDIIAAHQANLYLTGPYAAVDSSSVIQAELLNGAPTSGAAQSAPIPEPSGLVLLMMALATAWARVVGRVGRLPH